MWFSMPSGVSASKLMTVGFAGTLRRLRYST